MTNEITIDGDFPGGNVILEQVSGNDIFLRHDVRDTEGDWFYWAFRVRGAAGQRLTFHFTGGDVLGVRGPAVSLNSGVDWEWLGAESVTRTPGANIAFSYTVPDEAQEVYLAFCPLHTQEHLRLYMRANARSSPRQVGIFTSSRAGQPVLKLNLGNPEARTRVLLTARHHSCETMASYCLEGMIGAIFGEDELGQWLWHEVGFAVVPFVDRDGVEAGDQGKNRRPYDHNRDYGGEISDSIYPEVGAIREWAPAWLAGAEHAIALDLHCPWIRGGLNEAVYFVGQPEADVWQRVMDFSAVLETVRTGPLPFHVSDNLPHGVDWNTLEGVGIGKVSCSRWAAQLPGIHFASSLEVPYANAHGIEVTPDSARALGRDLAVALRTYLS